MNRTVCEFINRRQIAVRFSRSYWVPSMGTNRMPELVGPSIRGMMMLLSASKGRSHFCRSIDVESRSNKRNFIIQDIHIAHPCSAFLFSLFFAFMSNFIAAMNTAQSCTYQTEQPFQTVFKLSALFDCDHIPLCISDKQ